MCRIHPLLKFLIVPALVFSLCVCVCQLSCCSPHSTILKMFETAQVTRLVRLSQTQTHTQHIFVAF